MSELWAKWEGEVINGELPLRRLVGVSDHSGVFLTEAPAYKLANAAIKLVPAIPTLAESQLAHWNSAAALSHPRLLRVFASGRCQLPGGPAGQGNLHFLYVLMEYADQNLAQLLETRALTEIEARETLPPTLDALAFLHSRNLVQGQLKPSNILVVGEQLKLASDTIRPAGEAATSISMQSVYDPPEGRDGSFSTAGDVWALGVTLYEALTRTTPTKPDERGHGVVLPPDFPPASANVIRECLSRRPTDRPSVTALQAWISGKIRYPGVPSSAGTALTEGAAASAVSYGSAADAAATSVVLTGGPDAVVGGSNYANELVGASEGVVAVANARRASVTNTRGAAAPSPGAAAPNPGAAAPNRGAGAAGSAAVPGRLTIRAVVEREPIIEEEAPAPRSYLPWAVGAIVLIVAGWGGIHLLGRHSGAHPPASSAGSPTNNSQPALASSEAPPPQEPAGAPAASAPQASVPPPSAPPTLNKHSQQHAAPTSGKTQAGAMSTSVVHEEIPNVPHSALATIHGHVKVAVRVTVDSSGNVVNDSLDHPGPSHYFARVATQAARKWKFAPSDDQSSRQWLVHFDFSRTGTTAHATSARS